MNLKANALSGLRHTIDGLFLAFVNTTTQQPLTTRIVSEILKYDLAKKMKVAVSLINVLLVLISAAAVSNGKLQGNPNEFYHCL